MQIIQETVQDLLKATEKLRKKYPSKKFTLDGRLVGDLGEVIAAEIYDVELHEKLEKHYDGFFSSQREKRVQIKTTMQDTLTFPADHVPDFYLGLKIQDDGNHCIIYNGPGEPIIKLIKDRKIPKNNLHNISIKKLIELNLEVKPQDRIPERIKESNK